MPATRRVVRVLLVGLFVTFLAVQLLVPVLRYGSETSARFGWQMFSIAKGIPDYVVVLPGGEQPIDVDTYVAFVRSDLSLEPTFSLHLCRVVPGAEAVLIGEERIAVRCP